MQIKYGKHIIVPSIERSDRKSIAVSVLPSKKVVIKIPKNTQSELLKKVLNKKAAWIVKQQQYFDRFHPIQPPRSYQSGETHYYLGRQYRLKIKKKAERAVSLKGKYFHIFLLDIKNRKKIKKLLDEWYLAHAWRIYTESLKYYWPQLGLGKMECPTIDIKKMEKSWGSFSGNKRITLNLELIKAPRYCIEYVLVHELCHLVHPKHDAAFYRFLRKRMPDWEKRKERLERISL